MSFMNVFFKIGWQAGGKYHDPMKCREIVDCAHLFYQVASNFKALNYLPSVYGAIFFSGPVSSTPPGDCKDAFGER